MENLLLNEVSLMKEFDILAKIFEMSLIVINLSPDPSTVQNFFDQLSEYTKSVFRDELDSSLLVLRVSSSINNSNFFTRFFNV